MKPAPKIWSSGSLKWKDALSLLLRTPQIAKEVHHVPRNQAAKDVPVRKPELSATDLQKLLTMFSSNKTRQSKMLLFQLINQDLSSHKVRSKYLEELLHIMNEINLPVDRNLPHLQNDHFNKIVDGLNIIANNTFVVGQEDILKISQKDLTKLINNVEDEQELLRIFDIFYYTGNLKLKIAIEILLRRNLVNVPAITTKIFHDNKYIKWSKKDYNDFEVSLLQKKFQMGDHQLVKELISEVYLCQEHWISILNSRQISAFAERTLWKYALLFSDLETITSFLSHRIDNGSISNWLLLESYHFYHQIVTRMENVPAIHFEKLLTDHISHCQLTLSQSILLEFLSNNLVLDSQKEIDSILQISLKLNASSVHGDVNDDLLVRELSLKLLHLEQAYPDFDLIHLKEKADEFFQTYKGIETSKEDKVVELGRLLGFES